MGFRMRTGISILPGVRLNLTPKGVGATVGVGPLRFGVGPDGRTAAGVGGGGVGMRWVDEGGQAVPPPLLDAGEGAKAPGFLDGGPDKALYEALKSEDWRAAQQVAEQHSSHRDLALAMAALLAGEDDPAAARDLLETALASGNDPFDHPFMQRFPNATFELLIAPGFSIRLPFTRDSFMLGLAELYQAESDLDRAIETVEQVEPTAHAAVSLAELYLIAGRPQDVVDLTEGVANQDDTTAVLLVARGAALREVGDHKGSRQTFKAALRDRPPSQPVRHLIWSERAVTWEAQGRPDLARKDLERILKQDKSRDDVRERLAVLG